LPFGECCKVLRADVKAAVMERLLHRDSARSDRAERELWLTGHADLAHQHHVERCVQRARYLKGYRHSAARQAENYERRLQRHPGNGPRELLAGCAAIGEGSKRGSHGAHSLAPQGLTREYAQMPRRPTSVRHRAPGASRSGGCRVLKPGRPLSALNVPCSPADRGLRAPRRSAPWCRWSDPGTCHRGRYCDGNR